MKMLIFAFVLIMTTAAVNQQNLQEFTYMNEKLNNMKYTSYKCYESNPNKNTTKSKICTFYDLITFQGKVFYIRDKNIKRSSIIFPKILCSAVDRPGNHFASFHIYTKENFLLYFKSMQFQSRLRTNDGKNTKYARKHKENAPTESYSILSSNVIEIETALYFGRLNANNLYHVIYEEMIPVYEIFKYNQHFSNWENSQNLLIHLEDSWDYGQELSELLWKRFFPNIYYSQNVRILNKWNFIT